jgi:hypothetical protein
MISQENSPPPEPLPADEEIKLIAESLADDERWIQNLIAGLTGILSRTVE